MGSGVRFRGHFLKEEPKKKRSPLLVADTYKSICRVRKVSGLGCKGCVLGGTEGCLEDPVQGKPVPVLVPSSRAGSFGGRPVDKYVYSVDVEADDDPSDA